MPSNLPTELSSFVGRSDDLVRGAELLERSRLVTLIGAGGCGKTRVALRLAATVAPLFPDGVWWAELAPVDDGAATGAVLARVLGLPVTEPTAVPAVLDHLGGAHALVVLDNCEHLIAAVAGFVDRLLRATTSVRVVCTSRQPLRVEGECSWRLPSMAVPPLDVEPDALSRFDGARLFLARSELARPGGAAPPVPAVAQICGRLDGIPLAIELAAARTASLPLERIVVQLDDRFRLLNHGPRPAVARHQTLLASVEWSHDLLEPAERALLRRLGVFVGGFTAEAAEAVTGFPPLDPAAVVDVLAALTDKSLVQLEDSGRYRLLETIRAYATARLGDAGEARSIADRHLRWCVELAEGLEPSVERADDAALDRLDIESPNLWAAVDHASTAAPPDHLGLRLVAALGWFWVKRGHVARGIVSADRMLAADPDAPKDRVAAARCAGAFLRPYHMHFEEALSEATLAFAEAEAAQDVRTQGRSLAALGLAQMFSDPAAARAVWMRGLPLTRSAGDAWAESYLTMQIAYGHLMQYQPVDGQPFHDRSGTLAAASGIRDQLAWYYICAGMAAAARGRLDAARRSYLEGADRARRIRDPVTEAYALIGVATVELAAGRAGELFRIADALYGPYWKPDLPFSMFVSTLPDIACLGDQPERASGLIAGGQALLPVAPHEGIRHLLLGGSILLGLGDGPAARQAAETALAACLRITSGSTGGCRVLLARLDRHDGDGPAAERRVHEGLSEMLDAGVLIDVPDALAVLGGVAIDAGSAAEGARLLAAGAALRNGMGLHDVFAAGTEEDRDRASAALGEDFARVWREGSALDLDAVVAYARRARGERKRPSFGWDSLTPMEREVVRLAADGLSNPAIAGKLFVSRSTVKTHLVHVFAKLGVASRAELAAMAVRRSQV